MKSFLRIALFTLSGFVAVCAEPQGTIYNQTNRVCILAECTDAQFAPTATLSYTDNLQNYSFAPEPFTGTADWNGISYTDFAGTLSGKFRTSDCPYPWACYTLTGTFNNGHETVTENWKCFRTCGPAQNISGSVTVQ